MQKEIKNIVDRFIKGKHSLNDYRAIEQKFSSNENDLKHAMEEQFEEDQFDVPDKNLLPILNRIHQSSNRNGKQISIQRNKFVELYQKVASIALIPILLASALYMLLQISPDGNTAMAEIVAPAGARIQFELPDGSTGWLNNGGTLKYPVAFSSNRNVELRGEAMFDVKKDKNNPFTVNIPQFTVEVLGTKFNVSAYESDALAEVVLAEGRVKVIDQHSARIKDLVPGQHLIYQKSNGAIKVENVNVDEYLAWTEGKLMFRNEPLKNVAKRLGRWYNVDVIIEDKELESYPYRATFEEEVLDETLKLFSLTAPIGYRVEKGKTDKNGSRTKKKVILYLKE
ncbi:DUF4974 domain-containing protein [Puteibacter caeruleilacunae]|nr:DUF4974 domain-containing protein [Puteibacter caeruleilacunae]